jgi:hypothetical protein
MSDNRGADKKEYTPFIISLLKNTTLSYPKISDCVKRVFNVSLSRQSIYNYKNRYNIERPSENLLEPKDIAEYYGFHNEQDKELEIKDYDKTKSSVKVSEKQAKELETKGFTKINEKVKNYDKTHFISVPNKKNIKKAKKDLTTKINQLLNGKKEPKKASAKSVKKSEISNDFFVPIESIKQVLKVAKIQYKNKSLNENFQNHFKQVERFINEVAK